MLSAHAKFAEIHGGYATRNPFKLFENFIKIRDKKGRIGDKVGMKRDGFRDKWG